MDLQRFKCFVYDMVLWRARLIPASVKKKTLLIVNTNHIGDYILWRSVLPYIRKSQRFGDYHITFVGNKIWKTIFERLDASFADHAIWVDMYRFKKDMRYRLAMLKEVRLLGCETVINTAFSRNKKGDDAFVIACKDAYRIGQRSDLTNTFKYEEGYDKGLYNEVFNGEGRFLFEFYRDKNFTEFFLKEPLPAGLTPRMPADLPVTDVSEGKKYFAVFPGSSTPRKTWKAEHFAALTELIVSHFGWLPVICGGPGDKVYVENFLAQYNGAYINMCGKTDLIQFAGLLSKAELLVSVDTGSVHIAAAAGCPVFALFNGSHYGRYNPYPREISTCVHGIYPDIVNDMICSANIPDELIGPVDYDYNSITPETVFKEILAYFEA